MGDNPSTTKGIRCIEKCPFQMLEKKEAAGEGDEEEKEEDKEEEPELDEDYYEEEDIEVYFTDLLSLMLTNIK